MNNRNSLLLALRDQLHKLMAQINQPKKPVFDENNEVVKDLLAIMEKILFGGIYMSLI